MPNERQNSEGICPPVRKNSILWSKEWNMFFSLPSNPHPTVCTHPVIDTVILAVSGMGTGHFALFCYSKHPSSLEKCIPSPLQLLNLVKRDTFQRSNFISAKWDERCDLSYFLSVRFIFSAIVVLYPNLVEGERSILNEYNKLHPERTVGRKPVKLYPQ